jgi:hypothetical protein
MSKKRDRLRAALANKYKERYRGVVSRSFAYIYRLENELEGARQIMDVLAAYITLLVKEEHNGCVEIKKADLAGALEECESVAMSESQDGKSYVIHINKCEK